MKLKRKAALSAVAVGVIGALSNAVAAPVYEIQNIEDFDFVGPGRGTLESARNGYAQAINDNQELVGIALGRKKLSRNDVDDDIIDADDAIADYEDITYSVFNEIIANSYPFVASNDWIPSFVSVNGATAPENAEEDGMINSVDSQFFGINDDSIRVGYMTAPEKRLDYTGENENQDYWYYRDYEQRGVAIKGDDQIDLLPPYTSYTNDEGQTADVGGFAGATAINDNNLVVGYAGVDLSKPSKDRLDDSCLNNDDLSIPLAICIQDNQFPDPDDQNYRRVNYQVRGYVWQINNDNTVEGQALPLGMNVDEDDENTYSAQALGVNEDGVIVGRSSVDRPNDDSSRVYYDAAYWTKNADGNYEYHWIPVPDVDDDLDSVAYDINGEGIAVGSYLTYFSSQRYAVDKFFYYDTKAGNAEMVTPADFTGSVSDLRSRGRAINDNGLVVGYTEIADDTSTTRPHVAFLYDINNDEFSNINSLLTCNSKGYEQDSDGDWQRHRVQVTDGSGKELSYESKITVVDATGINADGTIVGTALIQRPAYQLDIYGNPVLDEDTNEPLFELNADGQPVTNSIPRMVVLKPAGAGTEACSVTDAPEEVKYERKGGALFAGLLGLLPFVFFRRKLKK